MVSQFWLLYHYFRCNFLSFFFLLLRQCAYCHSWWTCWLDKCRGILSLRHTWLELRYLEVRSRFLRHHLRIFQQSLRHVLQQWRHRDNLCCRPQLRLNNCKRPWHRFVKIIHLKFWLVRFQQLWRHRGYLPMVNDPGRHGRGIYWRLHRHNRWR